jgi:type IV fimbrial biogenesis protein FimT
MRRAAGFTMLEVMITMIIIGILAAVALPSFGYLSANTKLKGASTELYLALIRARAEAVKRNRTVAVVATSGDENNWQAGWQVIADANRDGDYADVAGGGDRLVFEQKALQRVTIKMALDTVEYRPTGRIVGAVPPAFDVAADSAKYDSLKRCVSADLTGRPFVKTEEC